MFDNLFSPIKINKVEIRNRIAYPSLGGEVSRCPVWGERKAGLVSNRTFCVCVAPFQPAPR